MFILPQDCNYSLSQLFGAAAESWAMDELTRQGWQARPISQWTAAADLVIDNAPAPLLVEVKAARRRQFWQRRRDYWQRRARYSWEVARLPLGVDSVVILVAQDQAGNHHPFIVPSWLIISRGVTVIHLAADPAAYASRGRGWLARFYFRWETITEVMTARQQRQPQGQLTLWGTVTD